MKGFLKAYQEEIEHTEIHWTIEKGKILSAVSDYQSPALRLRWGTAVVLSFIIVISAVLLQQIYLQPNNGSTIEKTELQKEIWLFPESIREVEFPQSIVLLTEWDEEDFQQFLNFFSPIEEDRNEKNNIITNSLRSNRFDQSIFA
jgi:predicted RND superfamily exporter protein